MSDENNDNRFFPINQPKVCNLQPEKKNVNDFNQTSNKLQGKLYNVSSKFMNC